MAWEDMKTAPKDGTHVLLASVDDDGTFGIRHGFFETSHNDRCWYDIDGEEIEPQFWQPLEIPPGAKPLTKC